jgi:hypothetical protein
LHCVTAVILLRGNQRREKQQQWHDYKKKPHQNNPPRRLAQGNEQGGQWTRRRQTGLPSKKRDGELDPEVEEGRIACGDLKLRRFALGMTSLNVRGGRKNCLYAVPLRADKV